ncbi:hypothetical protein Tco_0140728 [Tanacetum coccineum]
MSGTDNTKNNTSSPVYNMHEPKIGHEFLKILRENAFNGMDIGDVIDHITRVVKITKWIKIPDINKNQLRIHVFSKSLSNDVEKWWDDEIKGIAISWDKLKEQFFHKYYPLSKTCNSEIPDDLDNGTDYFEFLYWLASKFDNHWEIDKTTRCGLWEFYVNEHTKGTISDLHDEPLDESSNKTLAKARIARTSSNFYAGPCCKRNRLQTAEANMRLEAGVYDSWKLQGKVERIWNELAKLETSMKDVEGVCGVTAYKIKKGCDKASLVTKE